MKILKLLNKKFLTYFLFLALISGHSNSNEPVDIWNLENIKKNDNLKIDTKTETSYSENNSVSNFNNSNLINIEQDEKIDSIQLKLVGLYDPAENDLNLNMWEFSDGEKILKIVKKLQKIQLSKDAQNIYKKLLLTNAFPPEKNIGY